MGIEGTIIVTLGLGSYIAYRYWKWRKNENNKKRIRRF